MAKKEYKTTPRGKAEYAWLTRADTKFDKNGKYKINLIVPSEEAAPLIAEAKEIATSLLAEKRKAEKNPVKAKKIKLSPDRPFTDNEDGTHTLKFSMKAKVEPKTGEAFEQKPALFDSMGEPITKDIALGNGSICKVAYEAIGYSGKEGVGCTFRLKAVQVIKLVPYTGGGAAAFGFSEEEDGEFTSADAGEGAADNDNDNEDTDDDTDEPGADGGETDGADDDGDY